MCAYRRSRRRDPVAEVRAERRDPGRTLNAITELDVPVVQAVAPVFVVSQMPISLLVDISYGYLNPKVRVS